ncbi:PilW family protein [Pseudoxanthomonas sp.]|uniref:PilW family protein n=1 Tax=Pseudoxanthomonas sp. TaxID=1871049 RepID=UPI0026328BC0|nr:PilW family protein [Pseudoxanthomonas sp.]WDS36039.1 MAG: PilW family protein [Pseudoxanthomonas sp.]
MSQLRLYRWRRNQLGMSLIELMIALVIGLVLLAGVIQVFSASRTAYQLSQAIARNQENARFAMDFLQRDLRMVGHAGCVNDQSLLSLNSAGKITGGNIRSLFMTEEQRNDNTVTALPFPLRFDVSIQGFEAKGTSPGDTLAVGTPEVGGVGDWSPALPDAGLFQEMRPKPIKGSDIVVMRYLSPEQTTVASFAPPALTYPDESVAGATKIATDSTASNLFAMGDCRGTSVFQASAAPGDTSMTVSQTGLNKSGLAYVGAQDGALAYGANQAWLSKAEIVAYYVALNPDDVPSLYRMRWTSAPGGELSAVSDEMAEGVESMQLLYSVDSVTAATSMPSGYLDKSYTGEDLDALGADDAAKANLWRRVGAVQLGLLLRGTGDHAVVPVPADANLPQALNVTMEPANDGQYRSAYESTIALRNRLFGQ